jgi:hypothetical protein
MDPSLFGVVHELAPVLAALIFFACPVALFWIKKNHQLRMKELELEAQGMSRSDARLATMEKRLANIETALGAPAPPPSLQERAALLEGPGAPPETARVRQR